MDVRRCCRAARYLAYLVLYGYVSEHLRTAHNLMATPRQHHRLDPGADLLPASGSSPSKRCVVASPFELFYVTHFTFGVAIVALLSRSIAPTTGSGFSSVARAITRSRAALLSHAYSQHDHRRPRLPSSVTELACRPSGFEYRAGDFVFILIPALSGFEWHPFTASAVRPERRDVFTLHIRTLGDFTSALHRVRKHWPEIARGVIEPTPDIRPASPVA